MTAPHDLDRQLQAFLTDGPTELPDPSFDAVRDRMETTRQRVVIGPWRFPDMSKFVPIGLGAAAVVVALVLGAQLLGPPAPSGVGGAPSASPSASPSATPSPSVAPPSSATDGFLPIGPFTIDGPVRTTVTIPASGWAFDPEYSLIAKGEEVENLPEAAMLAWTWPAGTGFSVYGDPCHWASTTPDTPATTVDEIAAALAAQASRDASEPVDVTVGGYAGKTITLHVPNDWDGSSNDCDQENFASYGVAGEDEPARYHQGPGQIDELWIMDVDGAFAILDATYRPDTPAELIDELRAIAESATFE